MFSAVFRKLFGQERQQLNEFPRRPCWGCLMTATMPWPHDITYRLATPNSPDFQARFPPINRWSGRAPAFFYFCLYLFRTSLTCAVHLPTPLAGILSLGCTNSTHWRIKIAHDLEAEIWINILKIPAGPKPVKRRNVIQQIAPISMEETSWRVFRFKRLCRAFTRATGIFLSASLLKHAENIPEGKPPRSEMKGNPFFVLNGWTNSDHKRPPYGPLVFKLNLKKKISRKQRTLNTNWKRTPG